MALVLFGPHHLIPSMRHWVADTDNVAPGVPRSPDTLYGTALGGVLQGALLWALFRAHGDGLWPATEPELLGAFIVFVLAAPLAWYLTGQTALAPRTRAVLALALGTLLALLYAHEVAARADARSEFPTFAALVGMLALAHVVVSLASGFDRHARAFVYPRLFDIAWRNTLLVPVAGALTLIFWLLLHAAAWVLEAIGIPGVLSFLHEPATFIVASATVYAIALQVALRRSAALVTLRQFWLALNTWFLPLALLLAVVSAAAVAMLGVDTLFATHRAAVFLFAFVALAVLFANAAFQDGADAPALPRALARLAPWAWLALPALALLGAWALGLRVVQHGWTPERVWGALVSLLATFYAFGYALSLRRRGRWMATLPATNVAAAALLCACLLALLGPVADPRKLAVASQLARLASGATPADKFDFAFLARGAGRYGREALQELARTASEPVRTRAAQALVTDRATLAQRQDPAVARGQLGQLRVLPPGAAADAELLAFLTREQADWPTRSCLAAPASCVLWIVQANGDGPTEAVLLVDQPPRTLASLYAREPTGWRLQGSLHGRGLGFREWVAAIESGGAQWAPPRWDDLLVNGQRLQLR